MLNGGKGGIRTHGMLSHTTVFKTVGINHSPTFPNLVPTTGYDPVLRVPQTLVLPLHQVGIHS